MDDDQVWREKVDEEVLEAAENLFEYTEEGERLIRAELRRRGLREPEPPLGACPGCGRSINRNHPSELCVICDARLPAHILAQLEPGDAADDGEKRIVIPGARQCPVCGSSKVIPDIAVLDRADVETRAAEVEVYRTPSALVFRGAVSGELQLHLCGACGHAELHVSNFHELYDAYIGSLRAAQDAPAETSEEERDDTPPPAAAAADADGFCYHCGGDILPGATHCPSCGKSLEQT